MAPTESHHGIPKEVPRQEENHLENRAAKGVSRVLQMFKVATDHDFQISYYTPEQKPVAGTALSMKDGSEIERPHAPKPCRRKFAIEHDYSEQSLTQPYRCHRCASTLLRMATTLTGTLLTWVVLSNADQVLPLSKPPLSYPKDVCDYTILSC